MTPKLLSDTVRGMFNDERLQSFPEVQSLAIRSIFDDEKLIFNFVNTGANNMKRNAKRKKRMKRRWQNDTNVTPYREKRSGLT